MYVIYALIDPRDHTVHYVGQTKDVYTRFQQHIQCGSTSFIKNAWILELRAINKMVIMETLEEVVTQQEADEREVYWIRHFEELSEPLSNVQHRASLRRIKRDQARAARNVAKQLLATIHAKENVEARKRAEAERIELVQQAREKVEARQHAEEERIELARQAKEAAKERIPSAMSALKDTGKSLTLHAVTVKAGVTWRQTEEIEDVAERYGFELVRGKGRPAK